jgi:uncharacterized membrane protein
MEIANLLPLIGIPIVVLGFALRINALLVVTIAGVITAFSVGIAPDKILELFGEKFMNARTLLSVAILLPIIGLMEYFGMKERASAWVKSIRSATSARIFMLYFIVRQATCALGLTSLAGHPQTVRPLLTPMAHGAAEKEYGDLPKHIKDKIAAHAAACENVALFFGEDIFLAFGAVLLMNGFLKENGIMSVEPIDIGLWGIPTALVALLVHLIRLSFLDAQIAKDIAQWRAQETTGVSQ